jgi:hypothetical protein
LNSAVQKLNILKQRPLAHGPSGELFRSICFEAAIGGACGRKISSFINRRTSLESTSHSPIPIDFQELLIQLCSEELESVRTFRHTPDVIKIHEASFRFRTFGRRARLLKRTEAGAKPCQELVSIFGIPDLSRRIDKGSREEEERGLYTPAVSIPRHSSSLVNLDV